VAADDGPRPQTVEHLELLDALGIPIGIVAITKTDLVDSTRVDAVASAVHDLLRPTTLREATVVRVSSTTAEGLDGLRAALGLLAGALAARPTTEDRPRLAVDRVFAVRGRGTVATGTLRGGLVRAGDELELQPAGRVVRVREVQVHGTPVDVAGPGRTALNLASIASSDVRRGDVLARPGAVRASDRLLVALRPPAAVRRGAPTLPGDRARLRLHLGTDQVDARVGRAGREAVPLDTGRVAAILRLDRPVAVAVAGGDPFVLRDAARGVGAAGGVVLDAEPARGVSRRRANPQRVMALAAGVARGRSDAARLELHGRVGSDLADDVTETVARALVEAAGESPDGLPLPAARTLATRLIRLEVTASPAEGAVAARGVIDTLVDAGRLERRGERVGVPGQTVAPPDPREEPAQIRLVAALDRPAPPPLSDAAREAGCSAPALSRLERSGRIVRVTPNLAWSTAAWTELARTALRMAAEGPLSPAALRDATGTSRKYVMALLEDLNRRGILERGDAGHRPGPRAATLDDRSSVA
jgi:selenocysteine-specific elongation factor